MSVKHCPPTTVPGSPYEQSQLRTRGSTTFAARSHSCSLKTEGVRAAGRARVSDPAHAWHRLLYLSLVLGVFLRSLRTGA
jgi:hypothetical protein